MKGEVKQGRPCEVCRSYKRQEVEDAIYLNERVSLISQRFGLSTHSLYRHIRNHASPEVRQAFQAVSALDSSSFAIRIKEIADTARRLRNEAGSEEMVLKAAAMELKTLESLSFRMGIDHESTVQMLDDAKALARAVGGVARSSPRVAERIIEGLANQGADQMAEALAAQLMDVEPL